MNTAINPRSGEVEPCTRTDPPFFEGDDVRFHGFAAVIDTVDYDGDDNMCRVRYPDESFAHIALLQYLSPL